MFSNTLFESRYAQYSLPPSVKFQRQEVTRIVSKMEARFRCAHSEEVSAKWSKELSSYKH